MLSIWSGQTSFTFVQMLRIVRTVGGWKGVLIVMKMIHNQIVE